MIEVENLLVRFAGVTPIDSMSVIFPGGACGLIGPNGAGKTTFFNVLSGFVKPSMGTVNAFGEDLLKMVDYRRARWGLRRTFQTEQAIEKLSVFDNVAMIHEHSGEGRGSRRSAVMTAIEFVLTAELPGLTRDQIDIHVEEFRVVVRGARTASPGGDGRRPRPARAAARRDRASRRGAAADRPARRARRRPPRPGDGPPG